MLRRFAPFLLAVAVAAGSTLALVVRPATGAVQRTVDYVVVAGVPGLRWDDVNPLDTPTLWRLAEGGSIGSLSVRSAQRPTCPLDGWLTLGAGNYAAWSRAAVVGACPSLGVAIETPDRIGAQLPDQPQVVLHNKSRLPWGAVPGALAESVRCTMAIGPGAAVAAARPFGRVDQYAAKLPDNLAERLSSCVLSVVDLGTVAGEAPTTRASAARAADAALARVLAARPERSLVLVAGLADTDQTERLHVAVADGPGWSGGWLTSASTSRAGYLQLVDLAPTALAALGRQAPERLFVGRPATVVEGRPADLKAAIAMPADADREARAQRVLATWFFGLLVGLQLVLFAVTVPLLRWARRRAGPADPWASRRRLVTVVERLLVAAALAIPAALVADAVPWWRSEHAGLVFGVSTVVILGLATFAVTATALYRSTLGPLGLVAGLAMLVVGVDVLTGARLQLNGVAGYSALEGARYSGLGAVGLGLFIAGVLLTAGCLGQWFRRPWRPAVMVVVGGLGVVLVGSPYLGADAGGAVALTAGVCIAAAICTGGWVTFARLAWATLAGLAVTAGFALVDLPGAGDDSGGMARLLGQFGGGAGGGVVQRTGVANVVALGTSPLTLLAVGAAVFVWFALLRPWGGLKRLFGLYPAVRAAMAGIAVAAVIAGVLGGSALTAAGAAAAAVVPLAGVAALRVLDHAADRTPARPIDAALTPTEGAGPVDAASAAAAVDAGVRGATGAAGGGAAGAEDVDPARIPAGPDGEAPLTEWVDAAAVVSAGAAGSGTPAVPTSEVPPDTPPG